MDTSKILQANSWAKWYHRRQTRRDGSDYFKNHIDIVCGKVYAKYSSKYHATELVIVSLLHDIAEDTSCTLNQIFHEFGFEVAMAVDAITKKDGEKYEEYISRVRQNKLARLVKIVDIEHNLSDNPTESQKQRHEYALSVLVGED
jgi:(p)ppGpp synthase/HD superfamily hydrolase